MRSFNARGKLLLSGEYMVLHGAEALALPLKRGQSMTIEARGESRLLEWKAEDSTGSWFRAAIDPSDWRIVDCSSPEMARRLIPVLREASALAPSFREELRGSIVRTLLDYPRQFGFGSSSTLLSLVAQWSGCNPMELHRKTSEGSGYDVACAGAEGPILYRLEGEVGHFRAADFSPPFHTQLYFAWLGHKKDTASDLREMKQVFSPAGEEIRWFTEISRSMVSCKELHEFRTLMEAHETRLSGLLGRAPLSERFGEMEASVKSLGAWGGDFILIASAIEEDELVKRLESFGLQSVYRFKDLVYGAKA